MNRRSRSYQDCQLSPISQAVWGRALARPTVNRHNAAPVILSEAIEDSGSCRKGSLFGVPRLAAAFPSIAISCGDSSGALGVYRGLVGASQCPLSGARRWNVAPGGIYPDQVGSPAFSLELFLLAVNCQLSAICGRLAPKRKSPDRVGAHFSIPRTLLHKWFFCVKKFY